MARPNDRCPCGLTEKKYKKCCRIKGLYTKKSHLPSSWKNLGESHPSFRFSIGDRIETDLDDRDETKGHPQWIPGTIRGFNANIGAYDILLDYPVGKYGLDATSKDTNNFTRPFGFTKSATHKTDPCATCGLNEPTDGGVTFVQCAGCRRTRYCTRACQKIDWKKHRVQCQAIVAQNERVSVEIKELIKTGKSEAVNNALIDAAMNDDLVIIRKLLKKRRDDINVNVLNQNGATPLYMASQYGNVDTVKVLLKAGANVNQAEKNGVSPLNMASQKGYVDTVKALLKAGGNVNQARTDDGSTPLFIASEHGHFDIAKILIEAGADVNQAKIDNATPLYRATESGHVDIVKLLLNVPGIDIDKKLHGKFSPLMKAKEEKHDEIIKLLTDAGAQ